VDIACSSLEIAKELAVKAEDIVDNANSMLGYKTENVDEVKETGARVDTPNQAETHNRNNR